MKQNEFDALVSMAYNVGVGGLLGSTLYRNVCNGIRDKDTITSNFLMWNKAGGNVIAGLTRRRKEEAEMFLKNSKPFEILTINLNFDKNSDYNIKTLFHNSDNTFDINTDRVAGGIIQNSIKENNINKEDVLKYLI